MITYAQNSIPHIRVSLIPKKVKGDRDRRPFWAGGENEVARRVLEDLGGS